MHTTRDKKTVCRTAFVLVVFYTTVCITEANIPRSIFYTHWGGFVRLLMLIFALVTPMIMVWLDFKIEKNLKFISKASRVILSLFSVFYLLDILTFNFTSNHGQNYSMYHILFSTASAVGIMLMCVILQLQKKGEDIGFALFYKRYFDGMAIMLIMVFFYAFVIARIKSNFGYELVFHNNFVPFHGEIRDFFVKFSLFGAIRTAGNMLLFTTLSLTIIRFASKHKICAGIIFPLGLSLLLEGMELVLKSGSFDVDDLIINTAGAIIGAIIYKYVFARLLIEQERENIC